MLRFCSLIGGVFAFAPFVLAEAPDTTHLHTIVKRGDAVPVIGIDFPDPSIVHATNDNGATNGWWYAFATNNHGVNIQVAQSSDYANWEVLDGTDALPNLPPWVFTGGPSNVWAPDVSQLDDGSYIVYFTAASAQDQSKHCIGHGTSKNVIGPYDVAPDALFCPIDQGGAIDPSGFRDQDGTRYILYKVDGNAIGHGGACGNAVDPFVPTPIMIQAVAADGFTKLGDQTPIFDHAGASDLGIVEAPALGKIVNGNYFLFFSSGCYATPTYTLSYATSPSPRGPFTRAPAPLLATGGQFNAPGSADVSFDDQHMAFHATQEDGQRIMWTVNIGLQDTTVAM